MAYQVRDENGIMIAKVDNMMAGKIIRGVPGHWTNKNFKDSGNTSVFVIDDDFSWSVGGLKVYLWSGSYLRKD